MFGFGQDEQKVDTSVKKKVEKEEYETPEERSAGRPHNVGWLDLLGDEEANGIEYDDDDSFYESDNWREIIQERQSNRQK